MRDTLELHVAMWRNLVNAAGLLLIAYASLNISGMIEMATGVEGAISSVVLLCSALVIVGCVNRHLASPVYIWFVIFLVAYLFGGIGVLAFGGTVAAGHIVGYFGTLIFSTALYLYFTQRGENGISTMLRFIQIAFVIDCIAALNTAFLSEYFLYVGSLERATGVFNNPNETAIMALYLIVLAITGQARSHLWTAFQIVLAVTVLLSTFSKTGMLALPLLGAAYLIKRRAFFALLVLTALAALALPVAFSFVQNNPFGLLPEQLLRVEQVLSIFSGDVDDKATTGRLGLWELGLRRIDATFPFGSGIGSMHRMEGGYIGTDGDWLGVHNTYLMVLGEAGLVPFVLLLVFLAVLGIGCLVSPHSTRCVGIGLVMVVDMMVVHGAFANRMSNLMLVAAMALVAVSTEARPRSVPVGTAVDT